MQCQTCHCLVQSSIYGPVLQLMAYHLAALNLLLSKVGLTASTAQSEEQEGHEMRGAQEQVGTFLI